MFRIRRRHVWDAAQPKAIPSMVSWRDKTLFVHHTADEFHYTARTRAGRIREEREHMRQLQLVAFIRGFNDISYNFVVFPSGRVYEGRGACVRGAHTQGGKPGYAAFYNDHPGVSFAGNYETRRMTRRQVAAFRLLRARLRSRYGVSKRVWPHCRVFPTACPGRYVLSRLGLHT